MNRNAFWTGMRRDLVAMTVVLIGAVILATNAAAEYKILYQFKMPRYGANPTGDLIVDAAGDLYGTTPNGGEYGYGTVFRLKPNPDGTWRESVLHSFSGGDGANPQTGVILDAGGNLYGTTSAGSAGGYGVVFKLAPNPDGTWTESVLHSFTRSPDDGSNPVAGLTFDAAGNLYGTTVYGGPSGTAGGVVFKLAPKPDGTWTFSVLHAFSCAEGCSPYAGVVFDAAGNLYGTTYSGGDYGDGVVFKLTPNADGTWTESVLHSFAGTADGAYPGGLISGAPGHLYGTTFGGGLDFGGGSNGYGVAFELAEGPGGTWTLGVIHAFTSGADGADPWTGLIHDAGGRLYGTARQGGTYGDGVVFKLTPTSNGWREVLLHTFTGYGSGPNGLFMDRFGTLYGTAGSANNGFVYEIIEHCIDDTFVMPYNGMLYLQQKGGEAGASTDFGIGTSPANFVRYYSGLPNNPSPTGEVMVGYFSKGTVINFAMFTQFGAQSGWAFSTGSTPASVVAFWDVDNSLHMGGKITQQTSPTTWLLHLDDALSYLYDDDDNDVLIQIRVAPQ